MVKESLYRKQVKRSITLRMSLCAILPTHF